MNEENNKLLDMILGLTKAGEYFGEAVKALDDRLSVLEDKVNRLVKTGPCASQ